MDFEGLDFDGRTNKGGVTNLNVGTQIICERRKQKIFLYTTFCPVAPGTLRGVKADHPDKFQWGSRPHAVGG